MTRALLSGLRLASLAFGLLFACGPARGEWLYWTANFDEPENTSPDTESLHPNPLSNDAYVWLTVVQGETITRLTDTAQQLEGTGNGALPLWQHFEIDPTVYADSGYTFYVEIGAQIGQAFAANEGLRYTDMVSAGFIQSSIDPLGAVWNAAGSAWHAVPEPSSFLLLLMGGALLALRRRRPAVPRAAVRAAGGLIAGVVCLGVRAEQFHAIDIPNVVGVAEVSSTADYQPLVAQFGQVAVSANRPQNAAALVTNLVFTANLEAGDMLYAYDRAAKGYRAYELTKDKAWEAKTVHDVSVTTQDLAEAEGDLRHAWGYGFWIWRGTDVAKRSDRRIFLAGQVPVGSVTVTARGATAMARGETLIGNPFGAEWNLADDSIVDWSTFATAGDRIQLSRAPSRIFQWSATKGWVNKTSKDAAVIPAGESFWYQRPATENGRNALELTFPAVLPE